MKVNCLTNSVILCCHDSIIQMMVFLNYAKTISFDMSQELQFLITQLGLIKSCTINSRDVF